MRVERKWTQRYVSDQLRVDLESYKKYEKRTPLPPYLFESAARVFETDINFIVTGLRHGEVPGARLVEIPPAKKSRVS